MKNFEKKNSHSKEKWIQQLSNVITDPIKLLKELRLDHNKKLINYIDEQNPFILKVPRNFVAKMKLNDPNDPLLLQVLILKKEKLNVPGFNFDPLNEKKYCILPGLLRKYYNRVLLLFKSSCAINCRYCFRRSFPYKENQINKINLLKIINYINEHTEIDEVILSGGDPLMAQDNEIYFLINLLEKIPHLNILRIHSRLPIVIPSRITVNLCRLLSNCKLQVVLVTHINHANEIDNDLHNSVNLLHSANVTILNQSVLLHKINDNVDTLAKLSKKLFKIGILPYYIHMLDCVQGTSHFFVDEDQAKDILKQLSEKISGYLIPRLVREYNEGKSKKTLI